MKARLPSKCPTPTARDRSSRPYTLPTSEKRSHQRFQGNRPRRAALDGPHAGIARLTADVRQVLTQEAVRARLLAIGSEPVGGTAEELRTRVETDIRKWKELSRTAKLDS